MFEIMNPFRAMDARERAIVAFGIHIVRISLMLLVRLYLYGDVKIGCGYCYGRYLLSGAGHPYFERI